MDGIVVGFITIGFLIVINIAIAAYSYGRLSQKVTDLCRRVSQLEENK